ncbi:MAG: DUF362 domain-containing protein [Treponema sp.]|nr:DUF362 domain-containing protein [Treponema sp.]MCL2272005.1 DUF362 domain-containing protein [Treponema sp.]
MKKNEILVIYGNDIEAMAHRLAQEADLAAMIGKRVKKIGLKPNLVSAKPASSGATTHPQIAAGLINYLKSEGFKDIAIIEGAWVGGSTQEAFNVCGYRKLAAETGVSLIDTKQDKAKSCDCKGIKIDICESALKLDFMINLPVMKGHCQTKLTCALKNGKGLIPDSEKRRFHTIGLTKPIAHLNTVIRNDFIIVDGICGDLDYEEGGNPLYAYRMYAACDPVLCDAWTAKLMGYSIDEIPYIGLAEKLGIGSADLRYAKIKELNKSSCDTAYQPSHKVKQLAPFISENNACSACYASLIHALSRLDKNILNRLNEKICIGQGFKGKSGGFGTGQCCSGFKLFCPGCPPSGADIMAFLSNS